MLTPFLGCQDASQDSDVDLAVGAERAARRATRYRSMV